ncbi:Ig-like domain-containing protein [Rhizobium phaseoli]|uniref:VCBS repeat-containing protein n=1 Tax=Rhizobium phaseoli TaxID=396 RepID=A0ABM6C919_9HYPH|nr:Ig-like domain-containing protein [Rhizobium phaseoli]ANL84695.1 VCBS repeat-containing protein [Rhizobium phaseoli]ANL91202.1 VCBS repeat-containing protein [Rhizobium phaseoli]
MTTSVKPTAIDDYVSFFESDTIAGNLLENDGAGANGHMFLRFFDSENVLAKKPDQVTDIAGDYGTFHVKADGSYTYSLSDDARLLLFAGKTFTENVSYKISDGAGNTDMGKLSLEIKGDPLAPNQVLLDFEDLPLGLTGTFTYHGLLFKNATVVQADDGGKEIFFQGDGTENSGIFGSGDIDLIELDFHDGDGLSTTGPMMINGSYHPTISEYYDDPFIGHIQIDGDHFTEMYFGSNFAGTAYAYIDNMILQYDSGLIG